MMMDSMMDSGWSIHRTAAHHRAAAASEASLVLSPSGHPARWQVKNEATLMARSILERFGSSEENFDVVGARATFSHGPSPPSTSPPPPSHLALHVEELVAAACISATFASGEDPAALQTSGLQLLELLLARFGEAKDPDSSSALGETMLSTMASQITAALKPSLRKGGTSGYNVAWLKGGLGCLVGVATHLPEGGVRRLARTVMEGAVGTQGAVGEWEGEGTDARCRTLAKLVSEGGRTDLLADDVEGKCYEKFARMLKAEVESVSVESVSPAVSPAVSADGTANDGRREGSRTASRTAEPDWDLRADLCKALGIGCGEGKVREEVKGLVAGVALQGIESRGGIPGIPEAGKETERFLTALEDTCTGGEDETLGLCVTLLRKYPTLGGGGAGRQCLVTVAAILAAYGGDHESAGALRRCLARTAAEGREWSVWKGLAAGGSAAAVLEKGSGGDLVRRAVLDGEVSVRDVAEGMDVAVLMGCMGGVVLGGFLKFGTVEGGTEKAKDFLRYLLLAFKNLTGEGLAGEGQEAKLEDFLGLLLPAFVKVIAWNGLPNGFLAGTGTGPGAGGKRDTGTALGKTLAVSLLHFVKTAGGQFKRVMGGMEAEERGVLEKAVRGEMTGYGGGAGGTGGGAAKPKRLLKISAKGLKIEAKGVRAPKL